MVYRLRIGRTYRGKEELYTAFGKGYTSKKEAHESGKRIKKMFGVEHFRVVKRKTKGDLRARKHKYPLSRYKTQSQSGTSKKKRKK